MLQVAVDQTSQQLKKVIHEVRWLQPDPNDRIAAKACQIACDEAKRVIGTYEGPPLSASTLAKKVADTPLLETGEMRDSIEWTAHGTEGHVGSNSDIAVYQELGTKTIPPPVLAGAAHGDWDWSSLDDLVGAA